MKKIIKIFKIIFICYCVIGVVHACFNYDDKLDTLGEFLMPRGGNYNHTYMWNNS